MHLGARLRRTVSWADAHPDKAHSLVAVREFEPRCGRGAAGSRTAARARQRAEPCAPPTQRGCGFRRRPNRQLQKDVLHHTVTRARLACRRCPGARRLAVDGRPSCLRTGVAGEREPAAGRGADHAAGARTGMRLLRSVCRTRGSDRCVRSVRFTARTALTLGPTAHLPGGGELQRIVRAGGTGAVAHWRSHARPRGWRAALAVPPGLAWYIVLAGSACSSPASALRAAAAADCRVLPLRVAGVVELCLRRRPELPRCGCARTARDGPAPPLGACDPGGRVKRRPLRCTPARPVAFFPFLPHLDAQRQLSLSYTRSKRPEASR